ncbi:MAG: leucine-rich repeat domain-containing protein [Clostridiales bacterium]|nr:leucine-rich repeat domain-containing protein [Clostridiales bacterium]
MRKNKSLRNIIGLAFIITLFFVGYIGVKNCNVYADTINEEFFFSQVGQNESNEISKYKNIIEDFVKPVFGDKKVSSCEYAYNLDDSADYIFVEFENGGYAIYSKYTMEILEYSLYGSLPYQDSMDKKYYAGPSNYLHKSDNQLYNTLSGERIDMVESEKLAFAQQTRSATGNEAELNFDVELINETEINQVETNEVVMSEAASPKMDEDNLIAASTEAGYLIPNYNYFICRPTIGNNSEGGIYGNGNSGTCGPIAAQLLLGYHNYYTHRGIIEDRFLNGYSDQENAVTIPYANPNHCSDPYSMTNLTTGTRSEDTGDNSFYSEMVTRIMEPNTHGASHEKVKSGIEEYLSYRLSSSEFSVNYEEKDWWFGYSPIDFSIIKEELDSGRPIIISTDSDLGANNHYVVGYGYQSYTYPDGSGTYNGYVVHMGWKRENKNYESIWINSSWCNGYVSLAINHTHNYNIIKTYSHKIDDENDDKIDENIFIELKCGECGHRTLDNNYLINEEGIITGHRNTVKNSLDIPAEIDGIAVTGIGANAFENCANVTSITLPSGLQSIGDYAFNGCSSAMSITLPQGLESIGNYAFNGCYSITELDLPNSVQSIGNYAFNGCSIITELTLPSGLQSIGNFAFGGIGITSIRIPASVTNIGNGAFFGATFSEIVIESGNTSFRQGVNAIFRESNKTLIAALGSCQIPDDTAIIGSGAYLGTAIEEITIPASVVTINNGAFWNCENLTTIWLMRTAELGTTVIWDMYSGEITDVYPSLEGIIAPDLESYIEYERFSLMMGNLSGYLTCDPGPFRYEKSLLGTYTISKGEGELVGDIVIPAAFNNKPVVKIADFGFSDCDQLTSVVITPNMLTDIGDNAFYHCDLLYSVQMPDRVSNIGENAFAYCGSLHSIQIPSSITSIGDGAFAECYMLSYVYLPENVVDINDGVFANCNNLYGIIVPNKAATYNGYVEQFSDTDLKNMVQCEKNGLDFVAYGGYGFEVKRGNEALVGEIVIPSTYNGLPVVGVANNGFKNCTQITSVILPSTVEGIGAYAFSGCSNLTWVEMPEGLIGISEYAFANSGIEDVVLPSSLWAIESYAFANCDNLGVVAILRPVDAGLIMMTAEAFSGSNNVCFVVFNEDSYYGYYDYFVSLGALNYAEWLQFIMYLPTF